MAKTSAARQAKHREKQKATGIIRKTVAFKGETAETLRQLAKAHRRTQSEVIELGIMAAARLLEQSKPAKPAAAPVKRTILAAPKQRPADTGKPADPALVVQKSQTQQPAATDGEPWWPDNADQLLEVRRNG
ncbi:MAG: hypothetical protein AB7E55_06745 [Pigmentiphaga sp.]